MAKPRKERINRPFVGIPSFLRAPICTDLDDFSGDIAVMGVPFDEGSPYLAGSRMGPRALREHSLRFTSGAGGFYNPETRRKYLDVEIAEGLIVDVGDADVAPTNVERTFASVTEMVSARARARRPARRARRRSFDHLSGGAGLHGEAARHSFRRAFRLRAVHPRSALHQRPRLPPHRADGRMSRA